MGMPHLVGNPKRVQLTLEKTEAVVGQPTRVFARVLDSEYRPLTSPTVTAKLERLDAKPGEPATRTIPLAAGPGQPGEDRPDRFPWARAVLLLLFVGVVTAEWVLRKFSNLS